MAEVDLAAQTGEQGNPDDAPQRPSWLPDNFENEEAFAKSYKELERKLTNQSHELKAQQERFEEFLAEQQQAQQQQQYQTHQQDIYAQIEQAREMGDIRTEAALQAQLVAQALQPALQQYAQAPQQQMLPPEFVADYADKAMASLHPDWNDFREQAADWLAQNQFLITDDAVSNPQVLQQRLDVAYQAVKGAALAANPSLAAGSPDLAAAKQQAQTLTGAGQRQPAPTDTEEWARQITEANKALGGFRL